VENSPTYQFFGVLEAEHSMFECILHDKAVDTDSFLARNAMDTVHGLILCREVPL